MEDRLWEQLEAAAEGQARRGRVGGQAAAARTILPRPRRALATLATLAALVLAAIAVAALNQPAPPVTPSPPRIDSFRIAPALTGAAGGFGSLWTYDPRSQALLRVDPAGQRVLARAPFSAPWADVTVATSDDAVWAVSTHDVGHDAAIAHPAPATLVRIDPETDRITAQITLRAPNSSTLIPVGLAVTAGAVWVWGEGGAHRVDPDTNHITTAVRVPGERIKGFAADQAEAWAITDLGDLVRFDAHTGKRL